MNSERVEKLKSFLSETPDDPFLIYALALEYQADKPGLAAPLFERLLNEFPEYLPAYYQAASFYAASGNEEQADRIYRSGIELARQKKEALTLRELQSAYNQFLFETED